MTEIIAVRGLSYAYPGTDTYALTNLNFSVREGEFVGIIGPNGAGKTTLCSCLNGIIPHLLGGHLSGRIIVDGVDTKEHKPAELALRIATVFQETEAQISQLTVREEVAFGPENLGVPREEIKRRIAEALEFVGLTGLEDRSPYELSGGQQQLLVVACALAMRPKVLVLDEPTSQLDPLGTDKVFEVVHQLKEERETTIVMVEHKVEKLAKYADRVIVLSQGQVLVDAPPHSIFRQVETLQRIGINPPQVSRLAFELKQFNAYPLGVFPISVGEATRIFEQIPLLQKRRRK